MSRKSSFSFLILCAITILATIIGLTHSKPSGKVPKYIKLCKKGDPDIDKCLISLFESVRPKFSEGIPEIDLPPFDPLTLKEVVIFKGGNNQMKAIGRDVKIYGIKNFKVKQLKANIEKLEFEITVYFPRLQFEGTYDVNAKFVSMPVVGKGPVKGNATDITGKALLKAKYFQNKGERYVEFYSATVDVDVKDYYVKIDRLFPDKQLNDAINTLINDRKLQSFTTAKPIANKVAASMILDMVNKLARNLSFDEVFL